MPAAKQNHEELEFAKSNLTSRHLLMLIRLVSESTIWSFQSDSEVTAGLTGLPDKWILSE